MKLGAAASIAISCAAICSCSNLPKPTKGPPPGGVVSSVNQQGGITAYWIGQVNYQQVQAPDRQSQQLTGVIDSYQSKNMKASAEPLAAPVYIYLLSPELDGKPASGMLTIFVEEDGGSGLPTVCEVRRGISVSGIATSVTGTGREARLTVQALSDQDLPIVRPVCEGLSLPLSTIDLRTEIGQPNPKAYVTIFDYLSHQSGTLQIMLIPDQLSGRSFESVTARYYWAAALVPRYYRLPSPAEFFSEPDVFGAFMNMVDGEEEASFPAPLTLNLPAGEGLNAYPIEARQEFGDRIGRLDAQWLAYLVQSGLTIQGKKRPLMMGNQTTRLLPRFSRGEIGTPKFWRAASDVKRALLMVNCIAGRFLSDQAYRTRSTAPEIGKCAREETTLPAT